MEDKSVKINNSFDDSYDYLDDLMSDMMSTESDNKEISVHQEEVVDIVIEKDAKDGVTQIIEEDVVVNEPVNPGLQKKRRPLLESFFEDQDKDTKKEEVVNDKIIDKVDIEDKINTEFTFHHSEEVEIVEQDKVLIEPEISPKVDVISNPKANELTEKTNTINIDVDKGVTEKTAQKNNENDYSNSFSEDYDKYKDEDEDDVEEDDVFNSMFKDLVDRDDEENVGQIVDEIPLRELDKDVEVPLEKPGMEDIIVTRDGRSLSEMIPGIRSGQKKSHEMLADIRDQKRIALINNKKFSDDRYLKHVNNAEEKMNDREERIALSQKFLQKHANFTEQEKTILNNLGLSSTEFNNIMKSTELTLKDKEELIGLGRYGPEKHFKGKRYRTTLGDLALLEFLVKFKFANTRILRWISHEAQNTTWQKMRRLENNGLAESQSLIGVPDLWGSTLTGIGLSGYSLNPGLKPMPKMQTISSTMGVNYLAACLWFNTINVLNLDDFPASNKFMGLENGEQKKVRGEDLVSELEIRSSLGKEINPYSSTVKNLGDERLYDVIGSNVRNEIKIWADGGKVGKSPEFLAGNEYMWVLYPEGQLTLSYHVPDLVLRRERGPNGEPRSIAVELERYSKTNDRYDKTMLAYKLDEHLYEKVIWVTPNARVARELDAAAKQVGFKKYSIIPIITETGVYDKPDIWLI